jgi:hypothetical protein
MSQNPSDMRMGINCLSGQVRMLGLEPTNGDVYIFVGKNRKVMKILHWEYGGYVMYQKRLEQGRFHPRIFLRQGVGFRSMKWSELVLLMEGISPKVARRHRYEISGESNSSDPKKVDKNGVNKVKKGHKPKSRCIEIGGNVLNLHHETIGDDMAVSSTRVGRTFRNCAFRAYRTSV